jgi:hypothetical protein
VGKTETEARAIGRRLLIGRRPMTRVARAIEKGDTRGFMKLVVDAETRKILGAAILGTGGDEAIHGILDVMNAGLPYDVLKRAVPIQPIVSELIPTMLGEVEPVVPRIQSAPPGETVPLTVGGGRTDDYVGEIPMWSTPTARSRPCARWA